LYRRLRAQYGSQPWWPADTPFEVAVGAVLTQNAAWSNVEKAIERLKARDLLSLPALLAASADDVADAIRPSGYYNIKTQRLLSLCAFLDTHGGLDGLGKLSLQEQRDGLLSVKGVGAETADDILLYALDRPVFVIDTYTRRLVQRHGWADGTEPYEELRAGFEAALEPDVELYQQYHALIVMHAKDACRKNPVCGQCGVREQCATGRAA
jgi:endonuclease-3 related protein